ncbi:hypothetical protein CJO81_13705 [Ralstonia solanacearum]|nr:hypothetical protein CJO74_05860 [Ralstonia solanacearum]RAA08648.1 hypothetical protein DOT79_23175 [Ralstonia pseudosolanacearum]AXV96510.1 hypothetical protein CJO80_13620 [Ralstonia solanacearum]AXW01724.1 hypothetical protein CJO81_13705 [Ralstonia solanacearum]AXW29203.1 hypothetical protein CJO87_13705 [Ralstonia solanacearum]
MAGSLWSAVRTVRTWVRTLTVGKRCACPSRIALWPGRTPSPPGGPRGPGAHVVTIGVNVPLFGGDATPPFLRWLVNR